MKRILIIAAATLAALFVMANVVLWNQARASLRFSGTAPKSGKLENLTLGNKLMILFSGPNNPKPEGSKTPGDFGLKYETQTISETNGIRLASWYCPAEKTDVLVLMFHGYAMEKSSLLREAQTFHSLGLPVAMIDFRGSGDSSESYTTIGYFEAEDVREAFRFYRKKFPFAKIVLFGQSMGAASILRAVSALEVKPDLIVLEAVFDAMLGTIKNRFRILGLPSFPFAQLLVFWGGKQFGFNAFENNPVDYAQKVSCPALLFHGDHDNRALLADSKRVLAAIPGERKKLVIFAGVAHESYVVHDRDLWVSAVRDALKAISR
ncbi:MAG: alpha/beta fold hydrolase [Spirochaetia bacterium]|nr:alpha/beta fold hydrolase [Spirochaetia bacterium]